MNSPTEARLLPLGLMASRLGLQARELRAEADAGSIPCVRVGNRGLLFDAEAVEETLRGRARHSPSDATGKEAPDVD